MAKKANKNTFMVSGDKVTFGHTTKTSDGEVYLKTTFDFTSVGHDRLIYDAGSARVIKWRQASGIKEMTTAQALEKFSGLVVDCSKVQERTKSETPAEVKAMADRVKDLMKTGLSVRDAMKQAMAEALETEMDSADDSEISE